MTALAFVLALGTAQVSFAQAGGAAVVPAAARAAEVLSRRSCGSAGGNTGTGGGSAGGMTGGAGTGGTGTGGMGTEAPILLATRATAQRATWSAVGQQGSGSTAHRAKPGPVRLTRVNASDVPDDLGGVVCPYAPSAMARHWTPDDDRRLFNMKKSGEPISMIVRLSHQGICQQPVNHFAAIYVFGGSRPKSPASQPFAFSSRSGSQSTHMRIRGPIPPGCNALVIGFPQVGHSDVLRSWPISSGNHRRTPVSSRVL